MTSTIDLVLSALGSGLPTLILHFAIALALLLIGISIYNMITPFHERGLIKGGNVAAGIVFAGALIGLGIPLAATLAYSRVALDVLVWGVVSLVVQLIAYMIAAALLADVRRMIEGGNVAAALWLVGIQIGVALLNAGAMAG